MSLLVAQDSKCLGVAGVHLLGLGDGRALQVAVWNLTPWVPNPAALLRLCNLG